MGEHRQLRSGNERGASRRGGGEHTEKGGYSWLQHAGGGAAVTRKWATTIACGG